MLESIVNELAIKKVITRKHLTFHISYWVGDFSTLYCYKPNAKHTLKCSVNIMGELRTVFISSPNCVLIHSCV